MRIPAGTIEQQLRAAVRAGMSAEEATRHVLAPFRAVLLAAGNDSLVETARPSMLVRARDLRRQLDRKSEDRAFGSAPGTRERRQLEGLVFHLPDGTAVSWAEATREQHEMRIAWLQTFISSLEQDLRRHERVVKLLAERGAEKLSDIDGWEALVGDELDGDGEGDAGTGEG